MARLRSAPSTQKAAKANQPTRQALKEKTNTAQIRAPVDDNDGNVDKLVKNARPKRGQARDAARDAAPDGGQMLMAGGLGHAGTEHPSATDELAKSDGQPPPSNARSTGRPPREAKKTEQHASQRQNIPAARKRTPPKDNKIGMTKKAPASEPFASSTDAARASAATSVSVRKVASPAQEGSEVSRSFSVPPRGQLSAVKNQRTSIAQDESAVKPQTTPAIESSIFALKNFKRRPRQPSMLQMVQQRTASARPSAVTVQATEDPTVYNLDDDIEDDDEFAPDAEGTPLRVIGAKPPLRTTTRHSSDLRPPISTDSLPVSGATKRRSGDVNLSSSSLGTLRAKRQRISVAQHSDIADAALLTSVPDVAPPPSVSDGALLTSNTAQPLSSTQDIPPEPQIPSLDDEEAEEEFDVQDGTMAEPASSSPLPSPRRTGPQTDVMADPLTQASAPSNRGRAAKTRAKPLTTATLQSLLPKRRQPREPKTRVSEYDIESDSDQDDQRNIGHVEDEETDEPKSRSRTKTVQSKSKKPPTSTKNKSSQNKSLLTTRKSSAPQTRKASMPPSTAKPSKKHSRAAATTSDKENEDEASLEASHENDEFSLPDTSLSMYEAEQSKELEEARKKFAAVDEWDMDFESMSIEEGRSSSQEWR